MTGQCTEAVDNLEDAIREDEATKPIRGILIQFTWLIKSLCVAIDDIHEQTVTKAQEKEKGKKKELSTLQIVLISASVNFFFVILGWFLTEIAPRIFTIPHP